MFENSGAYLTNNSDKAVVILSITSDIGIEFALRKLNQGYKVFGTYRQISKQKYDFLSKKGIVLAELDLENEQSLSQASAKLIKLGFRWDCMLIASGAVFPIGQFELLCMSEWKKSLQINLIGPLEFLHEMLRIKNKGSTVIFFSGSGTNNAPLNYSAYTTSKIALIKACELLDAEISDTKFSIIGPGIVDTKIHEPTIESKDKFPESYEKLLGAKNLGTCTPISDILDCCDWIISSTKEIVGGKNFSVKHDNWKNKEIFEKFLAENNNRMKLRRYGNE